MCHFGKQQADRHLVGKPDQHPQHPPRHDLLQDRECALGYVSRICVFEKSKKILKISLENNQTQFHLVLCLLS